MNDNEIFARINSLFDLHLLKDTKVLIAGCGSGGGNVALQLAMSGICDFTLIDKDTLGPENVIRHVCGLRFVGRKKTDCLEEVILDRNPSAKIRKIDADILSYGDLEAEISHVTVVIAATDNEPTRYLINELCVKNAIPFVVARVFTRGIGGEVFSFRPGEGGCLACLEAVLERSEFRQGIREMDLVSEEERQKVYGMEIEEIKDSPGLNVDIAFVSAFHTRFVLDSVAATLKERPKSLPPIPENYIVWGNRPVQPFTKNFQIQRITLAPQEGCKICSEKKD